MNFLSAVLQIATTSTHEQPSSKVTGTWAFSPRRIQLLANIDLKLVEFDILKELFHSAALFCVQRSGNCVICVLALLDWKPIIAATRISAHWCMFILNKVYLLLQRCNAIWG